MDEWRELDLTQLKLDETTRALLARLLAHLEVLEAEVKQLREENQALRDELARQHGQKGRPSLKANQPPAAADDPVKKPQPERPPPPERPRRAERISLDRTEVVRLERATLPADFQSRGYRAVVVQNLRLVRDNVCYRLERGYSATTGQFYEAEVPTGLPGEGYGADLQALVLMAHFEWRVPEAKIVRLLNEHGVVISTGQVAALITSKHLATFAQERREILEAGLSTTRYQHLDDTGLRVAGVNHHLSVLTNPAFACFFIHRYKNAATVAGLLDLKRLDTPDPPAVSDQPPDGASEQFQQRSLRDAIEVLVTDGAAQFRQQTLHQALCWIHEERHYAKLWLAYPAHRQRLEVIRTAIWAFYERLKAYAAHPTPEEKAALWADFETLLAPTTPSRLLNDRLALTHAKKEHLLLVLAFPDVPLQNNLAERDLREAVVRRKIATGPRSPDGAQAWEVFLTLLITARKQGVNFFAYLRDRIARTATLPPLAHLVRAHASTG